MRPPTSPRAAKSRLANHHGRLFSGLLVLAVLIGFGEACGQTATDTWVGASDNWSVGANWLGGSAPPTGGGPDRVLSFLTGSYIATNDLGSPFQLNGLRFDGPGASTSSMTLASTTGHSLLFTGTNPFILQNTDYNAVVSSNLAFANGTTIGGAGFGNLTLSGVLSGAAPAGTDLLTLDGAGVLPPVAGIPGGSLVTLSNASSSFSGNVRLGSGNLVLGTGSALGAGSNALIITPANNSVRFGTTGQTTSNPITANGTLTFVAINGGTLAGTISGPGGLTVAGAGTLTLAVADSYSGATTVGVPGGGTSGLALINTTTLAGTSSVLVTGGGTLSIVNGGGGANVTDRIPDAVPVALQNGGIAFTAAPTAGAASGETFGPVTIQGLGSLTVTASSNGASSVLHFGPLTRAANGTLFVQNTTSTAQSVGGGPAGPNRTNVFFAGGLPTIADPGGAAGGQNTAVVPFLSGSVAGTGGNVMSTLGTYDANGVRLLSPTDTNVFAQASSALVQHANNNLTSGVNVSSGLYTLTSLVSNNPSSGLATLTGSGTIQVVSGAMVVGTPLRFSGPTLAFGSATGYLDLGSSLILTGSPVTGTGGVVVSSANGSSLLLTGANAPANPFTGGLFVNGNTTLQFSADNLLGATGQSVTLNGSTLQSIGTLTVGRPINLGPTGGTFAATSGAAMYTGPITGAGGLTIAAKSNPVTLAGTNSYSGPTTINSDVVLAGTNSGGGPTIINQHTASFSSPSNLSSGQIVLAGGTLQAMASGTVANDLIVTSSNSNFAVVAGQTLTYTGTLSGPATLSSSGPGTLVLSTPNIGVPGVTAANGGHVVLGGSGYLSAGAVTVGTGGSVRLDYSTGPADRLGPTASVTLQAGGELRMDGASVPTAESLGPLTAGGTITIVPGAGTTATLTATSLTNGMLQPPTLFRGTNLGGSAAQSAHINVSGLATGTVILNALADTSATGTGQDQAVYGTAGVRPAVTSDFTTGPVLQNAAPVNTPANADFRVAGSVTTSGTSNSVRSLRMEPGSTLSIPSGTLSSGGFVYVAPGGSSKITGPGSLQAPTTVLAMGDLNLSATINNESLGKFGPGTLTISGPASFSSLTVGGGTLVLNSGQAEPISFATIRSNLVLATPSTEFQVRDAFEYPTTVISGPGKVYYQDTQFLDGANTYSGGTVCGGNATLYLSNASALGTGPVTLGNTNLSPTTALQFNFGAGTFVNDVILPASGANSVILTFGAVTMSGKLRGGNAAAGTTLQFSGDFLLTNPDSDFTGTLVAKNTLTIAANSVLGNPANVLQLDGGTLKFTADGMVVPRAINLTVYTGTIDTGGFTAEVSGIVSGSGRLKKQGNGTLVLSGANTFTGDLILDQGTTLVTGSLAPQTTGIYDVPLEKGATLGGTGTINRTVNGMGGTLAPGLPTATGTLTVAAYSEFISGSTLSFRLDGPSAGDGLTMNGYDRLVTTGTGGLHLSGTALDAIIGNSFDPTVAHTPIFIIDDQAATPISGIFTGLPNGAVVNLGTFTAQISYFGDTATNSITGGNDVVLYNFHAVVPEPSSLALLAVAAGAALGRGRFRRPRS